MGYRQVSPEEFFVDTPPGFECNITRRLLLGHEIAGEPMPRGLTVVERLVEVMIEQALAGSAEHMKMVIEVFEKPPYVEDRD